MGLTSLFTGSILLCMYMYSMLAIALQTAGFSFICCLCVICFVLLYTCVFMLYPLLLCLSFLSFLPCYLFIFILCGMYLYLSLYLFVYMLLSPSPSLSPSLPVFSWCSLLSDASLHALEYYYDLQFYWKKGYSLQL